jgi:Uma2 family endonuclease
LANELGIVHGEGERRALDIAIYEKETLNDIPLDNKYLKVPPKVVIEVDTKADLENFNTPMDYVYEKTDDLLDFGVEKVIWIFTAVRKVMIAAQNERWVITHWNDPIPVVEDIIIHLEEMIKIRREK